MNFMPDIRVGDVFDRLAELPDESVDCVVSSPPYWGLRDYGVAGQLGMEPTLGEHIDNVRRYCREVWRVLKPSGTFWLNYGDCYATAPNGRSAAATKALGQDDRTFRDKPFSTIGAIGEDPCKGYLKPKDLCMIPNRVAIALQDDGWWVRSEIVWAKPNPMPESIKDRPANAHEKIWLLTKSGRPTCWKHEDGRWVFGRPDPDYYWKHRKTFKISLFEKTGKLWRRVNRWSAFDYYFDAEGVKQGVSANTHARISQDLAAQEGSHRANGGGKSNGPMRAVVEGSTRKLAEESQSQIGQKASREAALSLKVYRRNLRNYEPRLAVDQPEVWTFATASFSQAHFATFPPALAERCILAGCPEGGLVLDMFGGAGTTGLVAARLQRRSILIELNPDYARMARDRIINDAPLLLAGAGS